jgi:methyl-accepting chemotaxis protein
MSIFTNTQISTRIYLILALTLISSVGLGAVLYAKKVQNVYDMREIHLRDLVDTSSSLLTDLNDRVVSGEITLDAAQAEGSRLL